MQRRRGSARAVGSGGIGPGGVGGAGGGADTSYALIIDPSEDALTVAVPTSTVLFRIAAIGLSADIVQ